MYSIFYTYRQDLFSGKLLKILDSDAKIHFAQLYMALSKIGLGWPHKIGQHSLKC